MNNVNIEQNVIDIKNNIQSICDRCGRVNDIMIVGASKTMPQDVIDRVDSGKLLTALGENRVQELVEKYRKGQSFEWHFIGKLQTNKVKNIIDKVALIHSVDSVHLAEEIDKQAKKIGTIVNVLLQINMGKEQSKSGFFIEEIDDAIKQIQKFDNVKILGLMAVMPICGKDETINLFKELNTFWLDMQSKYGFKYLSAGMTNDYELAIEYAGSNIVRIGKGIFGERCYNEQI